MVESIHNGDATPRGEQWLDGLCALLAEQVAAAREGDLSQVQRLGESLDSIVAEAADRSIDMSAVLGTRREEVDRWYRELALILSAERADVGGRLRRLREVRRAVGAYGRVPGP
jgi:hypothetical protein